MHFELDISSNERHRERENASHRRQVRDCCGCIRINLAEREEQANAVTSIYRGNNRSPSPFAFDKINFIVIFDTLSSARSAHTWFKLLFS